MQPVLAARKSAQKRILFRTNKIRIPIRIMLHKMDEAAAGEVVNN